MIVSNTANLRAGPLEGLVRRPSCAAPHPSQAMAAHRNQRWTLDCLLLQIPRQRDQCKDSSLGLRLQFNCPCPAASRSARRWRHHSCGSLLVSAHRASRLALNFAYPCHSGWIFEVGLSRCGAGRVLGPHEAATQCRRSTNFQRSTALKTFASCLLTAACSASAALTPNSKPIAIASAAILSCSSVSLSGG